MGRSHDPAPVLLISNRRGSLGKELAELWRHRELVWTLGRRDIAVRYRQTALGLAWVVIQPLLTAIAFAVVFGRVAGLSAEGQPYLSYALAGLLGWTFFAGLVTRVSSSLLNNAGLLGKTAFPRLVLPLSGVIAPTVDLGVAAGLVVCVAALQGAGPEPGAVLALLGVLPLGLLAVGIGCTVAAASVGFRDVQQVVPVALQLALFLSPVAYASSEVPQDLKWLYDANPVSGALTAIRHWLLGTGAPTSWELLWSWGAGVGSCWVGAWWFVRSEGRFADTI